ncbi:MAG TPA: EamA family transporter [Anaerolineales bacterium]|nr:EamA family transporter [Anaerolineales bacterium]HMV95205.1 EamA family transporter [Anaerolineales bacterium]HMX17801.1 EamA family transporter [Anaerolineales bacterium]HMX74178.1 EamA family transporter [Anaerolineales bacterium]HMZ42191.1 EamA family transporter [Anaerolineales bacterium]
MPILALVLLFFSAAMHATWNFLLKSAEEKYIAMGWQVILSGVFSTVLIFFTGLPPRSMWTFAVISMILEAIYFILLCIAYSDHDFSLVYPIARGAAPALLVLWTALFLHEQLTTGGYIGLAMITGGMILIGATTLLQNHEEKPHLRGILTALSVALIISIYTYIDGNAVKHGPALPYGLSMFVMVPFVTTPYLVQRYGWSHFSAMWRQKRGYLLMGGLLGLVAYMLALFAYTFAPLSYSGAIREVSAVIGAFLGWRFLKEEMGGIRVVGSAIVFAGVMVIAVFG